MAIKLNRTIIPPLFFKHKKADPTADSELIIAPNFLRFDIRNFRRLISAIPAEKVAQQCGDGFDAIYRVPSHFGKNENRQRLGVTCEAFNVTCVAGDYTNAAFPSNVRIGIEHLLID